jgi:hypothetical protein
MLRHLPNLITLLRLALVWPVYWQISKGQYEVGPDTGRDCRRQRCG